MKAAKERAAQHFKAVLDVVSLHWPHYNETMGYNHIAVFPGGWFGGGWQSGAWQLIVCKYLRKTYTIGCALAMQGLTVWNRSQSGPTRWPGTWSASSLLGMTRPPAQTRMLASRSEWGIDGWLGAAAAMLHGTDRCKWLVSWRAIVPSAAAYMFLKPLQDLVVPPFSVSVCKRNVAQHRPLLGNPKYLVANTFRLAPEFNQIALVDGAVQGPSGEVGLHDTKAARQGLVCTKKVLRANLRNVL